MTYIQLILKLVIESNNAGNKLILLLSLQGLYQGEGGGIYIFSAVIKFDGLQQYMMLFCYFGEMHAEF